MGNAFAVPLNPDDDIIVGITPVVPRISLFATGSYSKDWAYTETEFSALPLFNLTGKGVRVGIIDSGISPHRDIPQSKIIAEKSFVDGEESITEDFANHGTSVAALIVGHGEIGQGAKGIAPGSEIVNVRILGSDGTADMSTLSLAVDYCTELGCDVINMSLGTQAPLSHDYTYYSALVNLYNSIQRAVDAGCIVVAAAGNKGSSGLEEDFVSYPAGFDNVIGVSGTQKGFSHNGSAQKNKSVFISAPGKQIFTAGNGSESSYYYVSGTSFASPIVAGFAALIKEAYPDATLNDVKAILKATATDLGDTGYDFKYGHGFINGKNLAKHLRNSDFYAYFNEKGQAVCANLGEEKKISAYTAVYSGARNTSVIETPFSLKYMEEKAIDLPENSNIKQFFWYQGVALNPVCSHLVRQ